MEEKKSNKSWLTSLILCWFLGFLGIHRIYAGRLGSGFLFNIDPFNQPGVEVYKKEVRENLGVL